MWEGKRKKISSISWTAEESRWTDETSQSERRGGQAVKRCCIKAWNDIQFLKKGIEVAQTSVEKGNHDLGEAMKGKTLNWDKIVLWQSKITMGLKRKTELKEDLRKLEEKNETLYPIALYFIVSWLLVAFLEPLNSIN